jgi:hypothetical protein
MLRSPHLPFRARIDFISGFPVFNNQHPNEQDNQPQILLISQKKSHLPGNTIHDICAICGQRVLDAEIRRGVRRTEPKIIHFDVNAPTLSPRWEISELS